MRDQSNFVGEIALALAAKAKSGTPFVSSAIDLNGFEGCTLVFTAAALGTEVNTYTIEVTDGVTSAAGDTPDVGLIGDVQHEYHTSPGTYDTSGTVAVSCYVGGKRYVKISLAVAGSGTGSGVCGVTVLKGHAKYEPVQ